MVKRFFGRHDKRVNFLIDRLAELGSDEAAAIAAGMPNSELARATARSVARSVARAHGRIADWSAGRSYGSSAADAAADRAGHLHYSSVSRGATGDAWNWRRTREACRDAVAVAAISDLLDPASAGILVEPIARACPPLRPLILGQ